MADLTLEVVEGPDAGRAVPLDGPLEIGRDPRAGFPLADDQASRRHARIRPESNGAVVEDLGSSNGTFVNHNELYAPTRVTAGDEILIGVSVIQVRSAVQVAAQPSAVRAVPAGLAISPKRPTYTDPTDEEGAALVAPAPPRHGAGVPELDRLVDARVKTQARLAPLAIVVLVVLVVVIYFGTT